MATTPTELCVKRGDTWQGVFKWVNASDGSAYDLTDATARLQVRAPIAAAQAFVRSRLPASGVRDYDTPILDLTTDPDGGLTVSGDLGYVYVRVEAAEMELLEPGSYELDQELTLPDGTVKSTETLTLNIVEDVTYG